VSYQFVVCHMPPGMDREVEIVRAQSPESLAEVVRILTACAPNCPTQLLIRVFPLDSPAPTS
jgi:hypothetical protein